MKTSDVISRWKRADIWTRFLFFLFSIILHIFFAYYFYTAKFDIKEVEVEKKVIEIRPILKETIVFPGIKRKKPAEDNQNNLTFAPVLTSPGDKPGEKKTSQIPQKPRKKKTPVKKDYITTDKKSIKGKIPGISKEPVHTSKPLKAPLNPSHYLKPETIDEILSRYEKEKSNRVKKSMESMDASDFFTGGSDIVIDHEGKTYFESKGFDISPWAQKVVARINENWFILPEFKIGDNAVVGIVVTFDKYGKVVTAKITRSSNTHPMDQSALNAILLSSPFPHLPDQFPGDQLNAFFLFNYKND
jgi:outer membrane biosynthesis protein TonB